MDYSKRYNELLTELKQLITEHNDEIFVSTAYNFISMNDNDGIAQAGSGSTEDQLAMLMVHIDAVRRTCIEDMGDKAKDAANWGFAIGLIYAESFKRKENTGDFNSKSIRMKI